MKFIIGIPNKDREVSNVTKDWKLYDKIGKNEIYVLGIIIGIALTFVLSIILETVTLNNKIDFKVYKHIYLLLVVIPIHELMHLVFFPNIKNATVGFSIKRFIFFVTLRDVISKRRFLVISIAPFLILTVVPFILLFYIESKMLVYFSLFNALASGVDIVTFFIFIVKKEVKYIKFVRDDLYFKAELS